MRYRWIVPAVALSACMLGLTLSSSPAVSTTPEISTAKPLPCNTQAPTKANGTKWKCVFYDGFSGKKLDRKKWSPLLTRDTSLHLGPTCYVDKPDVIAVSKGFLRLSVQKTPKPFTCKTNGKKQVDAIADAGSVSTINTFTQTYGLYQIRAAFPGSKVPGLQSAIWMFPKTISSTLVTTDSGEIDIAEFYTYVPDRVIPALHYGQLAAVLGQQWTNDECLISHPERFDTYTLDWSAAAIIIKYDGKTCLVNKNWTPIPPNIHPAPFNKAFGLILTQGLGVRGNALKRPTPPPAVTKVDWVRVWK